MGADCTREHAKPQPFRATPLHWRDSGEPAARVALRHPHSPAGTPRFVVLARARAGCWAGAAPFRSWLNPCFSLAASRRSSCTDRAAEDRQEPPARHCAKRAILTAARAAGPCRVRATGFVRPLGQRPKTLVALLRGRVDHAD